MAPHRIVGAGNLRRHAAQAGDETPPLLRDVLQTAAANLVPTVASAVVFSDERAPVETIIDSLVIRYLLQEGPAALPGLGG